MDSAAGFVSYFMGRLGGAGAVLLAASIVVAVFLIAVAVAGAVLSGPGTVVMAPFRW